MNIKDNFGITGTYTIFLFMGIFGIYTGAYTIIHTKDPNFFLLSGGIGIILMTTTEMKRKRKIN